MKNDLTTSPNRLDNILCLVMVAVACASAGYAAIGTMLGSLTA